MHGGDDARPGYGPFFAKTWKDAQREWLSVVFIENQPTADLRSWDVGSNLHQNSDKGNECKVFKYGPPSTHPPDHHHHQPDHHHSVQFHFFKNQKLPKKLLIIQDKICRREKQDKFATVWTGRGPRLALLQLISYLGCFKCRRHHVAEQRFSKHFVPNTTRTTDVGNIEKLWTEKVL